MCLYWRRINDGLNFMQKLVGRLCYPISGCIVTNCALVIIGIIFLKRENILSLLKQLVDVYSLDVIIVFILGKFCIWWRTLHLIHALRRLLYIQKKQTHKQIELFFQQKKIHREVFTGEKERIRWVCLSIILFNLCEVLLMMKSK
jgi:hypothetical protein